MRVYYFSLFFTLMLPLAAGGAPLFGTSASVSGFGAVNGYDSSGLYTTSYVFDFLNPARNINGTISSSSSPLSSSADGAGHAEPAYGVGLASAKADIGVLHALAGADSLASSPVGSQASAQSRATWFDTLTITSNTLAINTQVQLYGVIHLDGTLTISDGVKSGDNASGEFNLNWVERGDSSGNYSSGTVDCTATIDVFNGRTGSLPCTQSFAINAFVGDHIYILGSLDASAYADSGYACQASIFGSGCIGLGGNPAAVKADFSQTGILGLESQTAGALFASASGASYLTAVPEPETWTMLLAGLLTVCLRARRRLLPD